MAGNATGFAVSWHAEETEGDRSCTRFFSLDGLAPVQELTPDEDPGRSGRLAWTGSELVSVNDNVVSARPAGLDVHFRRLDASGSSHLTAGWGPWSEVNARTLIPGTASSHPDLANTGRAFGVVWIEEDGRAPGFGALWFATISNK